MSELLPCPFCGCLDVNLTEPETDMDLVSMICSCGASGPESEIGDSVKAWNRRAILPREKALLEAARDAVTVNPDAANVVWWNRLHRAIAAYDAESRAILPREKALLEAARRVISEHWIVGEVHAECECPMCCMTRAIAAYDAETK